tara:strand:+ start:97 stop:270 length:174 start_codon:yes stop_codon:yes gene_type:complete
MNINIYLFYYIGGMKWSKDENRMLSVMELPFIKKKKKGFKYYMRRLCKLLMGELVYV